MKYLISSLKYIENLVQYSSLGTIFSNMRFIISFFVLLAFNSGCAIFPPQLELPDIINAINEIEPYLQKAVEKEQPPSITLAVVKGGVTQYSKSFGYADVPVKKKATDQTIYQWWSLTKLFTAVAILQLQEKGLINIDDPVSKHLSFFKVRNLKDENQPITIRQLLSHSSGLGDIGMSILGWIHYEGDPHINQTDFLKQKLPEYNELDIQPGREGRYSNFGYLVLAGLIEEVSGKSYESYIIENILKPLKMEHTNFIYTKSMKPFEASGSHPKDIVSYIVPFFIDTDKAIREESNGLLWFNRVYSDQKGATGLMGSAVDMVRFMKAILNNGKLDGVQILSQSSIEKMQQPIISVNESPAPDTNNFSFGLGWFIGDSNGEITLTHGGAGMAFVTMLRLYPEKNLGVVVFANSTYLGRSMGNDIVNLVGDIKW